MCLIPVLIFEKKPAECVGGETENIDWKRKIFWKCFYPGQHKVVQSSKVGPRIMFMVFVYNL